MTCQYPPDEDHVIWPKVPEQLLNGPYNEIDHKFMDGA